jgi:hypothetical protein
MFVLINKNSYSKKSPPFLLLAGHNGKGDIFSFG